MTGKIVVPRAWIVGLFPSASAASFHLTVVSSYHTSFIANAQDSIDLRGLRVKSTATPHTSDRMIKIEAMSSL